MGFRSGLKRAVKFPFRIGWAAVKTPFMRFSRDKRKQLASRELADLNRFRDILTRGSQPSVVEMAWVGRRRLRLNPWKGAMSEASAIKTKRAIEKIMRKQNSLDDLISRLEKKMANANPIKKAAFEARIGVLTAEKEALGKQINALKKRIDLYLKNLDTEIERQQGKAGTP